MNTLYLSAMAGKLYKQYYSMLCYFLNYASFDGDYWYCTPGSHKVHTVDSYTNHIEIYGEVKGLFIYGEVVTISSMLSKLPIYQLVLIYITVLIKIAIVENDSTNCLDEFGGSGMAIITTLQKHLWIMVDMSCGLKALLIRFLKLHCVVENQIFTFVIIN